MSDNKFKHFDDESKALGKISEDGDSTDSIGDSTYIKGQGEEGIESLGAQGGGDKYDLPEGGEGDRVGKGGKLLSKPVIYIVAAIVLVLFLFLLLMAFGGEGKKDEAQPDAPQQNAPEEVTADVPLTDYDAPPQPAPAPAASAPANVTHTDDLASGEYYFDEEVPGFESSAAQPAPAASPPIMPAPGARPAFEVQGES